MLFLYQPLKVSNSLPYSARRATYTELLVQSLFVGPLMQGIPDTLMQNTLLDFKTYWKIAMEVKVCNGRLQGK